MSSRYMYDLRSLGFMRALADTRPDSPSGKKGSFVRQRRANTFFHLAKHKTIAFDEFGDEWFALNHADLTWLGLTNKTGALQTIISPANDEHSPS